MLMQRNQINLSDKDIKKNRAFLKSLYETKDLKGAQKWFELLNASVSFKRRPDENMTLDIYLNLMTDKFDIILQICSPTPDQIRFSASGYINHKVEKFVWITCPFNRHNYRIISKLFKEIYEQKIESIPVSDVLKR